MIDRSDRRRRFSRHLLQAMGLGTIAGIALTGACGGNVVVDPTTGSSTSGGLGGASSTYGTGACYTSNGTCSYSTGTFDTSTTFEAVGVGGAGTSGAGVGGGSLCDPATPPGQYATQVCVPNQQCSQNYSAQLTAVLSAELGLCSAGVPTCCGQPSIFMIDCGPSYTPDTCCYVVTVIEDTLCPP